MSVQQKWGWPLWAAVFAGVGLLVHFEQYWLPDVLYWVRRTVETAHGFMAP